jgi:hypothetical protein
MSCVRRKDAAPEPPGCGGHHSAAFSSAYWAARNFSASSAAMQPMPALVTAWR